MVQIATPAAARAAGAAEAQSGDVATDFAQAYVDPAIYVSAFRSALHEQVAECVAMQRFTPDQATEKDAFYDRYMDAWGREFPAIQDKIAATVRSAFDEVQLTELDTFYRSPVGHKTVALAMDQLREILAKSTPACGAAPTPPDQAKITAALVSKLSPLEIQELAQFGASDTGHKFRDFQPTLMAVLGSLIRDSRAKALEAAGLKKERS